jgi:hypothetical protein
MKVKDLIKELKTFKPDAEITVIFCYNKNCPVENNEECDSKNCHYIAHDIMFLDLLSDDENNCEIAIKQTDDWYFDENGELILEN